MHTTYLIIGLGNPGAEYADTRHNAGFMAVDAIRHCHDFCSVKKKFKGQLAEGELNGTKVLALKPETFMNNSGVAVQAAVRFYKIPPEQVIVLYDELDLPVGKVKAKTGGGDGGHNGIKSLDAHIGKGYRRIRLGIGHPGDKEQVLGYVLGAFSRAERAEFDKILGNVAEAIPAMIGGSNSDFTTKLALINKKLSS